MIGDVVAKPGRIAVLERIQDLREQHQIDFAIMNAENPSGVKTALPFGLGPNGSVASPPTI